MAALTAVDMERDITAWFASILGLTVDIGIFRGGIPIGVQHGVGVLFNGVSAMGTSIDAQEWLVQILGKYDTRDAAVLTLATLSRSFPRFGVLLNSRTFVHSAVQEGDIQPYQGDDDGKVKWFSTANFRICLAGAGS